jgi:hypothetical protein
MSRNSGRNWSRFSGDRESEYRRGDANLPNSRSSGRRNNGSSDHFRSPGGSGNAVRNSDDGFYDNFCSGSSNEFSREDQQLRSGTWEQHLQTPTSGYNYPDFQFASGIPSYLQAPTRSVDQSNNFYSGWKNQNPTTNSPSFTNFNSPNFTRIMNNNFTSYLNPNASICNPGIQNFNATAINQQLPVNINSTNLPSNTPTNVPSFSPVSSSNVPRYNPYLLDGNDLISNGQNGNFVRQSGHNDNYQQSLQFHQQLPFMHSSPLFVLYPILSIRIKTDLFMVRPEMKKILL